MRRLPPLPAVRAFEAAARHGTFSAAAGELGITQAAVSYQVKVLEERLGAPLFIRAGRRVSLTPPGARAAGRLTLALDEIDAAFQELRGDDDAILRLTATATMANGWLARHLGRFQAEQPGLDIRLDATDRLVDFAAEDIDIAIRSGRGNWPGLAADRLFDLDFAPACHPSLVAHLSKPIAPSHVLRLRRLNPGDHWWDVWLRAQGLTAHTIPVAGIQLDSQNAEGQAALAGHGLAMLTPALWRRELADGQLVMPFDHLATEGEAYWIVCAAGRRNTWKIARFRRWILDSINLA